MQTGIKTKIDKKLHNHPAINPVNILQNGLFRLLTTPLRVKPDFIIIGSGRAGTTSLYSYLCQHPDIFTATRKEIHYYSIRTGGYYKSNFPTCFTKMIHKGFRTGEASTSYLFHPIAVTKVKKALPDIKIIVLLRNPIELVESQYHICVKRGWEKQSLYDAIIREINTVTFDTPTKNLNYLKTNYIIRAKYYVHLVKWYLSFPKNQILIIKTDELKNNPIDTCNEVFDFIGVSDFKINSTKKENTEIYEKINFKSRKLLSDYFKPYNEKLEELTGMKFNWS